MIDSVFGPGFKQLLTSAHSRDCTNLENIDRNLVELAVAGFYCIEENKNIIWVVGFNENVKEKAARLESWLQILVPNPEDLPGIRFYSLPFEDPYINHQGNTLAVADKINLISDIRQRKPVIIITTLPALSLKLENREKIPGFFQTIDVDGEVDRDQLIANLAAMGYRSRNIVEERGDIAWRGSILDVFPIDQEHPVRIEIEGDTVVSIRIFDPDTQKSLKRIQTINFSLSRFFLNYENFHDYFLHPQEDMEYLTSLTEDYLMVVSDRKKVIDENNKLINHYDTIFQMAASGNRQADEEDRDENNENAAPVTELPADLKPPAQLFDFPLEKERVISIDETWDGISTPVDWYKLPKNIIDFNLEDIRRIREKVENNGFQLNIFSHKEDAAHLEADFPDFNYIQARIPFSFENRETHTIFLAEKHYSYIDEPEKKPRGKPEQLLDEICINDLVVHDVHGIGQFTGFKKLTFENPVSEFLKIEYLNKEYLYVPVFELDGLAKYVSFEGYEPRLDKMGGNSWATKQKRARKSIITYARDLLELYAMRKAIKGTAYLPDYELEDRLGESFEFVETEDQKRAFIEVFNDLEAGFPMDRLICGDVSFGKTEVAVRAAMRIVANGNQVAVLCPTTILAFQHYSTFKKRFDGFPVTIAMLSRMVKQKRKNEIYKQLLDGSIDIIIGTHSLLSKNIDFKRLGLYVIDEEQRFGVFQKEKLKKNREDVDVLSMSATPIPRTLSLSMAGLQDISTVRTPPLGRLAVKNFVGPFSKEIVVSAILNELERDGQVFIVYNNIEKIYSFQEKLNRWLPEVATRVLHAKMKSQEIETSLMEFINKKFRVLLSTTIIENGIDIPAVNTLIILDAHRFGLTQLYQLRGRIGRSHHQAFAYFLVQGMHMSEKAKARLDAIREFAELGSGYKLAEFDLKLRGAGSLLGNRQHGHIEALGFDYYHQLLVKAIKELKGETEKKKEGKINIHFSYSIEPGYIKNHTERISLYRRILEAKDFESIEELRLDLEDRYGRPDDSIQKIFFAGSVRVIARKYLFEEVDVYLNQVIIKFADIDQVSEKVDGKTHLPKSIEMDIFGEDLLTWVFKFNDYTTFPAEFIKFLD